MRKKIWKNLLISLRLLDQLVQWEKKQLKNYEFKNKREKKKTIIEKEQIAMKLNAKMYINNSRTNKICKYCHNRVHSQDFK